MSRKIRVGIVGLGGIAQKAYLPILTKETNWELIGAFTPNAEKRERICRQYRMNSFTSLRALSQECDAIFVHSSTTSHFEVVSYLLANGVDVYVDKPLAATLEEAERLAEMSDQYNRKLMVGFNRRFAPMYQKAKQLAGDFDLVHMEKHRPNRIGPNDYTFTLLDDYLHLVDTLRWLGSTEPAVSTHFTKVNEQKQLLVAQHTYQTNDSMFTSTMHRHAGSSLEKLEFMTAESTIRVFNMNRLEIEHNNTTNASQPNSWETILKTRGFEDCILHFISSVEEDRKPSVDGREAVKSQALVQQIIASVSE